MKTKININKTTNRTRTTSSRNPGSTSSNKSNLTAKQKYNLAVKQMRNARRVNKTNAQTRKYMANKVGSAIKEAGGAVAQVTTPFAASRTIEKTTETKYAAGNQAALKGLSSWNSLIDGNPDKTEGSEGATQDSTTGSILGG